MTSSWRRFSSAAACLLTLLAGGCTSAASAPSADTRTAGQPAPTPSAASTSSSPQSPRPSGTPSRSSQPPASGPVQAATEATGLTSPWALVALADGSVLVSERDTGKILQVRGEDTESVATLSEVEPAGEGGLLGIALSPDTKTLFAYYTAAEDNRIAALSWDGRQLGEPDVILAGIPKGGRHNGGRMVVGPDGYLYVGTGEVGEPEMAQDTDSLGGKILRLTLTGKPAPGNPFDNEVYSYGHRNVQGLAFDGEGRLWASEFGEQEWDELNLITKGSNYGWPKAEGSADIDNLVNPKVVWRTSQASPSGLAYWQGSLWMAALRGERLWEIPIRGTDPDDPKDHFTEEYGRLRAVTVANDGNSLLVTSSNTDGRGDVRDGDDRILRITR